MEDRQRLLSRAIQGLFFDLIALIWPSTVTLHDLQSHYVQCMMNTVEVHCLLGALELLADESPRF